MVSAQCLSSHLPLLSWHIVILSPTREDVILDLTVTNTSVLIGDAKIRDSMGCSGHALVEFTALRDMGQTKSKVRTLNYRKATFQFFKRLVNRTPETLPSGTREQNRAGRYLRSFSTEHKSSQSSLRTSLKWMDHKTGTGGAKGLCSHSKRRSGSRPTEEPEHT